MDEALFISLMRDAVWTGTVVETRKWHEDDFVPAAGMLVDADGKPVRGQLRGLQKRRPVAGADIEEAVLDPQVQKVEGEVVFGRGLVSHDFGDQAADQPLGVASLASNKFRSFHV